MDDGVPGCLRLAGTLLDDLVAEPILHVLQPASLELSLAAEQDLQAERPPLDAPWRQRLERARYHAERTARKYHAVEAEHRLVWRELERQWEETLRHEQLEQEAYARFCREPPSELTASERDAIRRLAQDVPSLWVSGEMSAKDRQKIVRLLLDPITIDMQSDSEKVDVTLHGCGGNQSHHRVIRAVARYDPLSTDSHLRVRIDTLHDHGVSCEQMAIHLNHEGFYPPKRSHRFSGEMVAGLLSRRGLHGPRPRTMLDG